MQKLLLVFLGAGIGGCLRYGFILASVQYGRIAFPWGTLVVNVLGSVLMGVIVAWLSFRTQHPLSEQARLFLTTGVLGGFTTFSAFSLDAVALWERGDPGLALAYVAGSVVLSIACLLAGLAMVRALAA